MMQKDVEFAVCFQNRAKIPLRRRDGSEKEEAMK